MFVPKFSQLIVQAKKHDFEGLLLAVDPGETTGFTVASRTHRIVEIIEQGQLNTWPIELAVMNFQVLFQKYHFTHVVYEAYHIYRWRLEEHTFSRVPTIQIIGSLLTFATLQGIPYHEQTAQLGKGFFKDELLKRYDMFVTGQPHARDSLRHAAHYLLFGRKEKS